MKYLIVKPDPVPFQTPSPFRWNGEIFKYQGTYVMIILKKFMSHRFFQVIGRTTETYDALNNWSRPGEQHEGWTKHHQCPCETLQKIINKAMLELAEKQNENLWNLILSASYAGGNAGYTAVMPDEIPESEIALKAATKYLKEYLKEPTKKWLFSTARTIIDEEDASILISSNAPESLGMPIMPDNHRKAINYLESRFCWMPGNVFLGPTPQSRLDDPGGGKFDMPPMGKGGQLTMNLKVLFDQTEAGQWAEVAVTLGTIAKEGARKSNKVIKYDQSDWKVFLLPGTTNYRKNIR